MWEEVYYKEMDKNYVGKGRRILPYAVVCKDKKELAGFIQYLEEKNFNCVEQIEGMKALLVNMELKRWCTFPKSCAMSCKDSKNYSVEDFMKLYYRTKKYPYTTELIDHYRKDFRKALLEIKDKGKHCFSEEQVQHIVDSYSDGDLAYDMQSHTPEELAEINTM